MTDCTVVTGAASGIGKAVAELLESKGERVFRVDLRAGDLAIDLTAPNAVETLAAAIGARYGAVKGFVHCAGFDRAAPLGMIRDGDVEALCAIHAAFPLKFLGWLAKKGNHAPGASCVLISSLAAHEGAKGHAAYAAAKGAAEGFLKPAAAELAMKGVRLNAVVLGVVATDMAKSWIDKLAPEQLNALKAGYPFGIGRPEDVARIIAFLLGEDSSWITGQTIVCDGGHSLA